VNLSAVIAAALLATVASAESLTRNLTLEAGATERVNAVVRVALTVPTALADAPVVVQIDQQRVAGQLIRPGLLAEPAEAPAGQAARELIFVLPRLAAGATAAAVVTINPAQPPPAQTGFKWVDHLPDNSELYFGDRLVSRYMRTPYDPAKGKREQTYKVYHHVFDPETGQVQLTKGPGSQFTHHRGLFFGFQKVTYGGTQKVNIWECPNAYQADAGTVFAEAGPVVGRHRVKIDWHGKGKDIFAAEQREVMFINTPGGILVDWSTRLETTDGPVLLDGDPQHAGFHFRAAAEVGEKNAKQTYYLRPDGQGKLDETRNWPAQKNHVNLPWDVMCCVIGSKRYSIEYIDRPQNPKEARFSERDYGRFGSYFVWHLDKDKPLLLNYRVWLQAGEMTGAQAQALSADFTTPVKVGP
jgi:hypothetical protein